REAGGAQCGHKQLHRRFLPRRGVRNARPLARVVHEPLLASPVDLAHRQPVPAQPPSVVLTELRVAVPVGVLLNVFQVQQLQRHPDSAPLQIDSRAVWNWPSQARLQVARVDPRLQGCVVQGLDRWPVQPGLLGPIHHQPHPAQTHIDATGYIPVPQPQHPFVSQNFSCLSHGQSFRGHRLSSRRPCGPQDHPASLPSGRPRPPQVPSPPLRARRHRRSRWPIFAFTITDLAVHDGPIFAFTMTDLAVHDGPIFAFTMVRNSHLRHSNVKTTTTVYGHLLPDYLRSEIDRLTFYSGVSKSGHADSSALLPVAPDAKKFGAHLLPGSESGPPGLPPGGGISEEFHNVGLAGWTGLE